MQGDGILADVEPADLILHISAVEAEIHRAALLARVDERDEAASAIDKGILMPLGIDHLKVGIVGELGILLSHKDQRAQVLISI